MSEYAEMSMRKSVTQRRLGRAVLLVGALMLSALNPAFGDKSAAKAPEATPTDQIIIKLRPIERAQAASLDAGYVASLSAVANARLQHFRPMSGDAQVFKLPSRLPIAEVQAIARRLSKHPDVEYAEPDYIMHPMLVPNDPEYNNQWHYKAFTTEVGGANLPAAWDITTGSVTQVVAVIDTGLRPHVDIDTNILDTTGRVAPGYDFISDTTVANDGDGRDSNPTDPGDNCGSGSSSWHGTHVAGTIGALSNNGVGVAGVNWNSKILPVRVLGRCGGSFSDVIDGMRWSAGLPVPGVPANDTPAKVLNLSLGGFGACGQSIQTAINNIVAAGSVVVVAAGNSNADASSFVPANCNGVITVAANNRGGDRAFYSNFSTTLIEISAPGGAQSFANDPNGVLSTLNSGITTPAGDNYIYYQGTSMAAPHVAGIASLMLSVNPALTPAQVGSRIQSTARPFAAGTSCLLNNNCGAGIINAAAAVAAAAPSASFTATATSSSRIVLGWIDESSNETGFKIERKLGLCASINQFTQITTMGANIITHANINLPANTTHSYRIRAFNAAGNSAYSNCASARTGLVGTPNSPSGLRAISAAAGQVNLAWADNSINETSFKLFRRIGTGLPALLATKAANAVSHSDTTALNNASTTTYSYFVRACNSAGCSPATTVAVVPFRPATLAASREFSSINLTWADTSANETGFQIFRKTGNCASLNPFSLIATKAANSVSHSNTGLPSGTHAYRIRSFTRSLAVPGARGFSLSSACVSATTCTVTPISIGQTVNGALSTTDCRSPVRGSISEPHYADRYSFSASAGQQVAISLTSAEVELEAEFDTYLYLIGPGGSVITEDDDSGEGFNSRIPSGSGFFTLPSSGTYSIEATSFGDDETGNYTLSLTAP